MLVGSYPVYLSMKLRMRRRSKQKCSCMLKKLRTTAWSIQSQSPVRRDSRRRCCRSLQCEGTCAVCTSQQPPQSACFQAIVKVCIRGSSNEHPSETQKRENNCERRTPEAVRTGLAFKRGIRSFRCASGMAAIISTVLG